MRLDTITSSIPHQQGYSVKTFPVASIIALATASPSYSIEQSDAALLAQHLQLSQRWNNALPSLYRRSGVHRRKSVLLFAPDDDVLSRQSFYTVRSNDRPLGPTTAERMECYSLHAPDLMEAACRSAIAKAEIQTAAITHFVTASCTGFMAPGVDHAILDRLALRDDIHRTHVGFMGCHGLINALRVGESIARSDPNAMILIGAVELCTLHQQYTDDAEQLVANALFGDGAACAVIAQRSEAYDDLKNAATSISRTSLKVGWKIVSSFSYRLPATSNLMGWLIGDHGFKMKLSPEVPKMIESQLQTPILKWLESIDVPLDSVGFWAIHPGGPRILDAVATAFELSEQAIAASRRVLQEHGNMSSPTIFFILESLENTKPGDFCLTIAFGPGLHAEAMLLERE